MAERRPAGFVKDVVLRLIRMRACAVRPVELIALLREEGHVVPASMVFRALRDLIDRGAVRKIHVAGGYITFGDRFELDLWCRSCGQTIALPDTTILADLHGVATIADFTVSRYIVEVLGVCRRCDEIASRGRDADRGAVSRARGTAHISVME